MVFGTSSISSNVTDENRLNARVATAHTRGSATQKRVLMSDCGCNTQPETSADDLNEAIFNPPESPSETNAKRDHVVALEQVPWHAAQVTAVMMGGGVHPEDISVQFVSAANEWNKVDDPDDYVGRMVGCQAETLGYFTEGLRKIEAVLGEYPEIGLVNISSQVSRAWWYPEIFADLECRCPNGSYKFPKLRYAVYGSTLPQTPEDAAQKIAAFVRPYFENSPKLQEAKTNYDRATKDLYKQGVLTVVSAGNSHDPVYKGTDIILNGDEINDLSNEYTLTVGATDEQGNMAWFSSRGDGRTNPDVAAHGQNVPIPYELDGFTEYGFNPKEQDGLISGTSFSAPQITGFLSIANQYANTTPAEEKAILKRMATDTRAPAYEEGAGVFFPYGPPLELVS